MPTKLKKGTSMAKPVPVHRGPVEAHLPKGEITPRFFLAHHPTAWDVEDGVVLPTVVPRFIEAGVGRVDYKGDTALMEAEMLRRGWRLIPDDAAKPADTADSAPGYLRAVDVQAGTRHVTAWDHVRVVGDRLVVERDKARWATWRQELVRRGIIAEPDPHFLESKARLLRDGVLRAVKLRARTEEDDLEVKELEGRIAAFMAAADHIRKGGKLVDLWKRQAKTRAGVSGG